VKEAIQQLVKACTKPEPGNPLLPDGLERFCTGHQISLEAFSYHFAKHVALEFAEGVFSYRQADAAMNRLSGADSAWKHSPFAETIYEAFDAGEFLHDGDPQSTISWQKYTLPAVMEALSNEGLLPRA
jgi:hypothetical protein